MVELDLEHFEQRLDLEMKRTETKRTYVKSVRLFLIWLKKNKRAMDSESAIDFFVFLKKNYLTDEGKPLKASSLRTYQSGLRAYFRLSEKTFPKGIKVPAVVLDEPKYLSFEEYTALYKAAYDGLERAMLLTIYATGMRIGEAVSRTMDDLINWDVQGREALYIGSKEQFRDKTNNPAVIPLTPSSVSELHHYFELLEKELGRKLRPNDPLFMSEGRAIPTRTANDIWHRMVKRAGIKVPEGEGFGWHIIRHTRATHLRMQGTPLEDIGSTLRHRSMATTLRYAHTDTEALRSSTRGKDPLTGGE
ncbi:MAG: tyrosine-type recombinase/integrase [Dehalococcoidia bacterium]